VQRISATIQPHRRLFEFVVDMLSPRSPGYRKVEKLWDFQQRETIGNLFGSEEASCLEDVSKLSKRVDTVTAVGRAKGGFRPLLDVATVYFLLWPWVSRAGKVGESLSRRRQTILVELQRIGGVLSQICQHSIDSQFELLLALAKAGPREGPHGKNSIYRR